VWNEIVTSCVELASFNARDALRQLDYAGVTVSLKSSLLLLLLPTFLMIEGIARDRSYIYYSWWYWTRRSISYYIEKITSFTSHLLVTPLPPPPPSP
jgi:hypothetical protein